jgi:hypothetical protein
MATGCRVRWSCFRRGRALPLRREKSARALSGDVNVRQGSCRAYGRDGSIAWRLPPWPSVPLNFGGLFFEIVPRPWAEAHALCTETRQQKYLLVGWTGRAFPSHGRGRRFNPYSAHQQLACKSKPFRVLASVTIATRRRTLQEHAPHCRGKTGEFVHGKFCGLVGRAARVWLGRPRRRDDTGVAARDSPKAADSRPLRNTGDRGEPKSDGARY